MDFSIENETFDNEVLRLARIRVNKSMAKRNVHNSDVTPLYVVYARKSTKGTEKQERSIQDQLAECKEFAKKNNLRYSDILVEEESAKKAGKREVFYEMLDGIKAGKYNSIIAWHPDRLARNMKDAGTIIDMIDIGEIVDLKFPAYTFSNDASGKMALGIQFVLAKQYSDSLSDTTKRGGNRSVQEGRYMGKGKFGYEINANQHFRKKKDEFEVLRNAWNLALKGFSINTIVRDLGLEKYEVDSKKLSRLFADPFYAGVYCFGDNTVELKKVDKKFEVMVTSSEFLKVKGLLHKRRFQRTKIKNTILAHFVKCGYCDRFMSPGISKGRSSNFFYLNCMNKECEAKKSGKINRVRGYIVRDKIVELLKNNLNVTREFYDNSIDAYKLSLSSNLKDLDAERVDTLDKIQDLGDRLNRKEESKESSKDVKVKEEIALEIDELYREKAELKLKLKSIKKKKLNLGLENDTEIMTFEDFLNHCQNLAIKVEKAESHEVMDEIARTIFLNLTVGEKKVRNYELQEPYRAYAFLGTIKHGVADGI